MFSGVICEHMETQNTAVLFCLKYRPVITGITGVAVKKF